GMDAKRRDSIGKKRLDSDSGTGMGLYNVNRRLIMTFGEESRLIITSQPERGTAVSFSIPKKEVRKRSEEHTSELQSRFDIVCRLLLEKKNKYIPLHT